MAVFAAILAAAASLVWIGERRPGRQRRISWGKPPLKEEWVPHSPGASARRAWASASSNGTAGDNLSEKAGSAMYEDDYDDRFEAALRLAEDDPVRGAEALRSIAADDAFDPDTRFEAAARLAEVDEPLAAEALRSIAADDAFASDIRSEAAARLAEVDPA